MSNLISDNLPSLLELPVVSRIRRNHGLEHATLHVLARRFPKTSLAGHSDANGFRILGNVSEEDVRSAAQEALQRLQNGEDKLAVHPFCGTNIATMGIATGLAASLAMFGTDTGFRNKLERIPLAITLATFALLIAQPLGLRIQKRITTSGNPGELKVVDIRQTKRGGVTVHRIITQG